MRRYLNWHLVRFARSHVAARSRRGRITPLSSNNGGGSPRISYRAICIAQNIPGLQRHRPLRQGAFAIPPPGAGVRGKRFPICTDLPSPSLPPAVAEGDNALKRNRGWRREIRISQRFRVSDAAVSWREWSWRPAVTKVHRVAHARRGCPLSNSRRERKGVFFPALAFGEVCRSAPPGAHPPSPTEAESEE